MIRTGLTLFEVVKIKLLFITKGYSYSQKLSQKGFQNDTPEQSFDWLVQFTFFRMNQSTKSKQHEKQRTMYQFASNSCAEKLQITCFQAARPKSILKYWKPQLIVLKCFDCQKNPAFVYLEAYFQSIKVC